jgi:alpha-L-fucosidase 2
MIVLLAMTALAMTASLADSGQNGASRLPGPDLNLKLAAPINTWDEAIPLGNGLLGGLLWGKDNTIRLSLDRGDLWDERPANGVRWKDFNYATIRRLVGEGKADEVNDICDKPYFDAHPSKLPAGRLEIALDPSQQVKSFELDLATAQGYAHFADGRSLSGFFSAAEPVALLRIPGPEPKGLKLLASGAVQALGYTAAKPGSEGRAQWFVQEAAEGLRYCVCLESRRVGDATLIAVTVTSTREGPDPLALARKRVAKGLEEGYEQAIKPHLAWWKRFWEQSSVSVPEPDVLRHYYLVQYFYGAASRLGAPPMPLQGVWTADENGLPPWKGDYHNDLNTQMTYIAYQTSGRFDEGRCYLEFLWNLLPTFRKFAKDFYDAPGAAVPGVMSLAGQPLGGWGQYSLSPTMGAWSGHLFYLHWRYTHDDQFLRTRAYPWCSEVGECLRALLKPDANGVLKLPLSTSPEIFDSSATSWLKPDSNYDIACLRMLFLALSEMADACGKPEEARRWTADAAALGPLHVTPEGVLKVDADHELPYTHRHLSNIIAIDPFNLVTVDNGAADRRTIAASLKQWDKLGTGGWCGYTFSWMSCLRARVGDAEAAMRDLDIYVKAFILRNGFHANGDQTASGFSGMTYRPFTLEGNFLAAQAVQEMLLQSWSPTPGQRDTEVIRVFPATPWRWHEASFEDLRAEGGHRVSARRENNATIWLRVVAGHDGIIRIRDNFGGRMPRWNRAGVKRSRGDFEVALKSGEAIEATLAKPAQISPKPADVAEPLVIKPIPFIRSNNLPLRFGADSNGGDLFNGDIAGITVVNRPLSADEMRQLAERKGVDGELLRGQVVALDLAGRNADAVPNRAIAALAAKIIGQVAIVDAGDGITGKALRLDGNGFLEIANDSRLDCLDGLTVAAWVRPHELPPTGSRIIDKSPVGAATAYLLDTCPGDSLRLIIRDPHLIYPAKLPLDRWTHVAATVSIEPREAILYVNGREVARAR